LTDDPADHTTEAPAPEIAHLVIHTGPRSPDATGAWDAARRGLRLLYDQWVRRPQKTPMRLEIEDFRGQSVVNMDSTDPLVELPLAPGTYHVTLRYRDVQRRYTLKLNPSARLELQLWSASDRTGPRARHSTRADVR
jgi:hypothetical protein